MLHPQHEALVAAERALAADPRHHAAREAQLDLLFAGLPADMPGMSLPWAHGAPPRVAVITPYWRESPEVLARCAASVRAQTIPPALHVFVADGHAEDVIDGWNVTHVRLPSPTANSGDTPRAAGGRVAVDAGCTAVAYLDADNAWRPRHLESLLTRHAQTGAPVCHAGRSLHEVDGALMPLLEAGDNVAHVDTSCILVTGAALPFVHLWGSWPRALSPIGDRMFWTALVTSDLATACTGALTVLYTADRAAYYRALRRSAPPRVRADLDFTGMFTYYDALDAEARARLDRHLGFAVGPVVGARRPTPGRGSG
ncbi:MAG: glycosyltransferase [Casimicrobiaceae bacterium]